MRRLIGVCLVAAVMAIVAMAPAASAAPSEVFSWGYNFNGQLGDGTTTQSDVPVLIEGLNEVTSVSGGEGHGLALLASGTVMAWGRNQYGELGDGTTERSDVPIAVPGLENVTAVSAGADFSLALLRGGTVMAWGAGGHGQLGDGSTENSDVPVPVSGLEGVSAIAARGGRALALLEDGTVVAWGNNANGELGDGSTESSDVPVAVSELSGVTAIAAGPNQSLALVSGGAAWAWGDNEQGQLGDGTTEQSDNPVPITSLGSGITSIAGGTNYSLALAGDGHVWAWGSKFLGKLGDGEAGTGYAPVPAEVGGLTGVTAISGGDNTSLALLQSGHLAGWGGDEHGELGIGEEGAGRDRVHPVELPAPCGVTGMSAAYLFEIAIAEPGVPCPAVTGVSPEAGREVGGTTVSITGSGLAEATAVDFGGVEATSFTVNSPTSITAVTPPGRGSVIVTVSVPGATSVPRVYFNYREPPVPGVRAVSPKGGPTAGGTHVTITGYNLVEVTSVHFGSAPATDVQDVSSTEVTAVSPPGAKGKSNVTATNVTGTSPAYKKAVFKYKK